MSLTALRERLSAATGPLHKAAAEEIADLWFPAGNQTQEWLLLNVALRGGLDAVGAALALVERKLPKDEAYLELSGPRRFLNIPTPVPDRWCCELFDGTKGWGPTAPLAIILARLAALEAKEQTHE